ncbi:MAG TPA: permease [Clostridia bacterium]|nr:permease [Clostridia bacterium]
MINLLKETITYVIGTLIHNAPILAFGILVAAAITVYVDPEKLRQALMKRSGVSIAGSVAFGAFTPFCACGTMAVIVSMMTTALPWGPIMAFLTSSPLMSPDEFILYSGIISIKFAAALTAASLIIGVGSGYITHFIEKNTSLLENQARFSGNATCCGSNAAAEASCCSQNTANSKAQGFAEKYKLKELFKVFYEVGVKRVLIYFAVFAAIGFLINKFIPAEIIMKYLGSGNIFAVPLLALIGLPLYVSGSSAIPIINALMIGGASQGALLAFMITGPGTSAGVLAGLVTIMKKRAIGLYVAYLLVFAIILGYLYDFLLMLGI